MSATITEVPHGALTVLPEFDDHESVTALNDPETGLRGFIAIHNTNLGTAVGGTRFWLYESEKAALCDALRLSRAMTYKCALANLSYGGAKAVLIRPSGDKWSREAYLDSYAQCLESFAGRFFTGEDVGLSADDVRFLAQKVGRGIIGNPDKGELPGPWAARSVYAAMEVALETVFGDSSFKGHTVAIKGLGHSGYELCALVCAAGGNIIASDIDPSRAVLAQKTFPGIRIVPPERISKESADVYAPCALGDEFNAQSIPDIAARIVCGVANNQLATPDDGRRLFDRNILYIPDYVANAGGLIDVADELEPGGFNRERVARNIEKIKDTVRRIIEESRAKHIPTNEIADDIGKRRFESAKGA
ncbi:MAG: Glu/Leu/Phe/Val dehydrogenase dimerization domain-containing protein [bacterium]|nr:Glu/Leu/Phe/Val dehydrogenase dimerization domain-containing protein [bacterium]